MATAGDFKNRRTGGRAEEISRGRAIAAENFCAISRFTLGGHCAVDAGELYLKDLCARPTVVTNGFAGGADPVFNQFLAHLRNSAADRQGISGSGLVLLGCREDSPKPGCLPKLLRAIFRRRWIWRWRDSKWVTRCSHQKELHGRPGKLPGGGE